MATWNDVAVTLVGVPTVAPGMVVVAVSPGWKPDPLTVSVVVAAGGRLGVAPVIFGSASTVKHPTQVPVPPSVVTLTLPGPVAALAATSMATFNSVLLTNVTESMVMPDAENDAVASPVKPVPVTTRLAEPPWTTVAGL